MTKRATRTDRNQQPDLPPALPENFGSMVKAVALRGGDPKSFSPMLAIHHAARVDGVDHYRASSNEKMIEAADLLRVGDSLGALDEFINAVIDDPDNIQAYINIGQILEREARIEECIDIYSEALSMCLRRLNKKADPALEDLVLKVRFHIMVNAQLSNQISSELKVRLRKSGKKEPEYSNLMLEKNRLVTQIIAFYYEDVKNNDNIDADPLKNFFDEKNVPQESRAILASKFNALLDEVLGASADTSKKRGRKPQERDPDKDARTIARLKRTLSELCMTDLSAATADDKEAVRISHNLRSTVRALKARGVTELPPEAIVPMRNSNRIITALHRRKAADEANL